MKGYTDNPTDIMQAVFDYRGLHTPHVIEVRKLRVRMPLPGDVHIIVDIHETPHYQYTQGNTQPYKDWLREHNHLYDESLASFEHLMNDDSIYLESPHDKKFIKHDHQLVITDGVHRATRLYSLGVDFAPVLLERAQ